MNFLPSLAAALLAAAPGCARTAPARQDVLEDARPEARPAAPADPAALERAVVAYYAAHAHRVYARSEAGARALLTAIETLTRTPSRAALVAARDAWLSARDDYGQTEALRFYGGPVDDPATGVESLMNAWPLDEAYIDGENTGIINDPTRFPHLDATLLPLWNERGGEANVSVGWHAIEFLLWGRDTDPAGPGDRPYTDFIPGAGPHAAPHADRRARYLELCGELLVHHLAGVRAAWEPDADNYRAAFVAAPPRESLRKILAGVTILSAFEMSGERLAVAYETRDQEEEHSCFSDNTLADFAADQRGILDVWRGDEGPGLRDLAQLIDAELAAEVDRALEESLAAIQAVPPPFDQAILGEDDAPGRRAILAMLLALERQSELFASLALSFGFEIALHPGG